MSSLDRFARDKLAGLEHGGLKRGLMETGRGPVAAAEEESPADSAAAVEPAPAPAAAPAPPPPPAAVHSAPAGTPRRRPQPGVKPLSLTRTRRTKKA